MSRNRTSEINNRITNRHGNKLTKRWNRDRDQKKKKKENKHDGTKEERKRTRDARICIGGQFG